MAPPPNFVYTEPCSSGTRGRPPATGVSFEEAATVFADPDALDGPDLGHSEEEARSLRLSGAATGRVLIVAYYREEGRPWREHPHHQRAPGEPQGAGGLCGVRGLT